MSELAQLEPGWSATAASTGGVALGSRYVLKRRIGRGAMGEVWSGVVRETQEDVAVKLLRPELGDDPDMVARFLRERAVLTRVDNPHVVRVHDLVVEGERLAIVMDLVAGSDLRHRLAEAGTLPPGEAVELVMQILDGLAAVHATGIVHRDLKPENVLLDLADPAHPVARLSDFGIARLAQGPAMTRRSMLIGTPEYMAPEVADAEHAKVVSDLYAVGVVLYELIAGRTPFAGGTPVAVLRRHLEMVPIRPEGIPDELWAIIAQLLDKRPRERPQNAEEVAARLRAIEPTLVGLPALPAMSPLDAANGDGTLVAWPHGRADADPTELLRAPHRPRPVPWYRKRRTVVATAALLVVAIAGGGVWVLSRPSSGTPAVAAPPPSPLTVSFSPAVLPNGLVATRSWSYDPTSGHLGGRFGVTNPEDHPITGTVDEVVAKTLASTVAAIHFTPAPDRIVQADPVVRYTVTGLAPGAAKTWSYDIPLAPGLGRDRLDAWVADENAAVARARPAVTLAAAVLTPTTLSLTVGQTAQLTLSGTMSDGSVAAAAVLGAVQLMSTNPSVATVSGLTVTATGPGSGTINLPSGVRGSSVGVSVAPASIPSTSTTGATGTGPQARVPAPATTKTTTGFTSTSRPAGSTTSTTSPTRVTSSTTDSTTVTTTITTTTTAETTPSPTSIPTIPPSPSPTPTPAAPPSMLTANQVLSSGQSLQSASGNCTLTMQTDGNLVLSGRQGTIWSITGNADPNYHSVSGSYLKMQNDGNLVVITQSNVVEWSTGTAPVSGPYLVVQDNGDAVMYDNGHNFKWDTATDQHTGGSTTPPGC